MLLNTRSRIVGLRAVRSFEAKAVRDHSTIVHNVLKILCSAEKQFKVRTYPESIFLHPESIFAHRTGV